MRRKVELPPERCALLEKRCVRLLDRVRSIMVEQYDEHCAFEVRLEKCCSEHPSVKPFVEKVDACSTLHREGVEEMVRIVRVYLARSA